MDEIDEFMNDACDAWEEAWKDIPILESARPDLDYKKQGVYVPSPKVKELKCWCGKDTTKDHGLHSNWCPKYK